MPLNRNRCQKKPKTKERKKKNKSQTGRKTQKKRKLTIKSRDGMSNVKSDYCFYDLAFLLLSSQKNQSY
jgi:hypothetical protein